LQESRIKPYFGALKIVNKFLMMKKNAMTLISSRKSLMSAFIYWKINVGFPDMAEDDHIIRKRSTMMNVVANIMRKNINIVEKNAFWELKL
jgi:hypothetical protein